MSTEQRESIEGEFFSSWVFQEELFQKYLDDDDMMWLYDETVDETVDENIIESLPNNINVEKLVEECIGHNALVRLCHSHRDLFYASRVEYLIGLLINAELIPLKLVNEMQRKIYRATEDWYLELNEQQ